MGFCLLWTTSIWLSDAILSTPPVLWLSWSAPKWTLPYGPLSPQPPVASLIHWSWHRVPRVKVYFAMIVGWGSEVRKQGKGKRSKTEGWEKRNETKSLFVALSHQPQAPFFAMVLQAPNRTPMSHRKRDWGILISFSMRMPFRLIFWNLLPKSVTWIG